jgi:hypothetical protein
LSGHSQKLLSGQKNALQKDLPVPTTAPRSVATTEFRVSCFLMAS